MLKGLVTSCPEGAGDTVMYTFVVAIWPGGISSVSAVKAKRMTHARSLELLQDECWFAEWWLGVAHFG